MGRISSMRRQYKRKASEVHPLVAAMISGGTPASRSSTAPPPIWKLWPRMWVSASAFQMSVTNLRNSCLSRFFDCPEVDLYVKRADVGGMSALMARWFFRALTGQRGSALAVRMIEAPSSFVVLVHGIRKLAEREPSRN